MEIAEINNKNEWEEFLLGIKEKTFLNSWNWGEFQKKTENKIWRLGVYDKNQLEALALAVRVKAKRGTFIFLPHGPIIKNQEPKNKEKILNILVAALKETARKNKEGKAGFIRLGPIWEKNKENIDIFRKAGFREAPIHIHPELTWELNVQSSEEELLGGMRKTTRYLIKQGQKKQDIKIIKSCNIEDLEKFNKIYYATAKRHNFVPFSLNYLESQFSSFSADDQILIFLGIYKNELLSAAIVVYWQKAGFYHHGASLSKYSSNRVPLSYLIQWEAIKEAKRRGCEKYNFWGIAPEEKKIHPWIGLSLFKKGFGGYKKEYVKTQDFPVSRTYWLTYVFEKLRKVKRGL